MNLKQAVEVYCKYNKRPANTFKWLMAWDPKKSRPDNAKALNTSCQSAVSFSVYYNLEFRKIGKGGRPKRGND